MALITAADAAYSFDYTQLPPDVSVVLGYIGGDTPHVWTLAEVEAVHAAGLKWWPIFTAPSRGQAIDRAQGARDGNAAVQALPAYGLPLDTPVFYDVEYADWAANPATAKDAIDAFKATLAGHSHPNAFAYVPYTAGFDWIAYWDNVKPTELPAGWVGQQYGGNAVGGKCDLSVFDTARLGIEDAMTPQEISSIAAAVWAEGFARTDPATGKPTSGTHSASSWLTTAAQGPTPAQVDQIATAVIAKLGSTPSGAATKQDVIDALLSLKFTTS